MKGLYGKRGLFGALNIVGVAGESNTTQDIDIIPLM
jgi:hypothetical protein